MSEDEILDARVHAMVERLQELGVPDAASPLEDWLAKRWADRARALFDEDDGT